MATFLARAKPYKLKPTEGENITRDDISTWSYTMQACARQMKEWKQFLPGSSKENWKAKAEDPSHGWEVLKDEDGVMVVDDTATDDLKAHFEDFLTFIASHCPSGFMNQVMRESVSYTWIIDNLYATYGLETKGENFLGGNDLKFEFSPSFTYTQALMKTKDFYVNCLLRKNSTFKGKALTKDEELGPLAENFIIEKCLSKIDPRLPEHVKNTRGHLFTEQRPTLACNQKIIFSQIDSMIAELDGKDSTNISVSQVRAQNQFMPRGRFPFRGQNNYRVPRPQFRGSSNFNRPRRPFFRPMRPNSGCIRCMEAR